MTLLHLVAGARGADNETDKELKAWHEPASRTLDLVVLEGTKVPFYFQFTPSKTHIPENILSPDALTP